MICLRLSTFISLYWDLEMKVKHVYSSRQLKMVFCLLCILLYYLMSFQMYRCCQCLLEVLMLGSTNFIRLKKILYNLFSYNLQIYWSFTLFLLLFTVQTPTCQTSTCPSLRLPCQVPAPLINRTKIFWGNWPITTTKQTAATQKQNRRLTAITTVSLLFNSCCSPLFLSHVLRTGIDLNWRVF